MASAFKAHTHSIGYLILPTILALALLLSPACADSTGPGREPPTSIVDGQTNADGFEPVTFLTEDGLTLSGRVFSPAESSSSTLYPPDSGAVLCHMYPADQTSWEALARELADQGLLVLTFNFRGYGASEGSKDIQYLDRDVMAAVRFMQGRYVSQLVLVGASMGGTAGLKAAAQLQTLSSIRLAGMACLSAPVEFRGLSARDAVPGLVIPLLFLAAEGDEGASGARELQSLAGGRGRVLIVPGSDHGTELLTGDQTQAVKLPLLRFLQDCLSPAD